MRNNLMMKFEKFIWNLNYYFFKIKFIDFIFLFFLFLFLFIWFFINFPAKKYIVEQNNFITNAKLMIDKNKDIDGFDSIQPMIMTQMESFVDFLPRSNSVNKDIFNIQKKAELNKLELESVNYQYVNKDDDIIFKQEIEMKLIGNYYSQRKFIYDILVNFPSLSISKIEIIDDADMTSSLALSLKVYYKIDSEMGDK